MRTHLVGHTYEGALMRTHYYEGNNEEASVTYILLFHSVLQITYTWINLLFNSLLSICGIIFKTEKEGWGYFQN